MNLSTWTNSVWMNVPAGGTSGNAEFIDGRNSSTTQWGGGFDEFYDSTGNGGSSGQFYTEIPNAAGNDWLTYSTINANLSPGSWHLVTTTVQDGSYSIYVDGSLAGTNAMAGGPAALLLDPSDFLGIGQNSGNLGLEEFQLYNGVLTPAQIATLYSAGNLSARSAAVSRPTAWPL